MPGKTHNEPPLRSEQLGEQFNRLLADFETGVTDLPPVQRLKELTLLARFSAAIDVAAGAEHRTRAAAAQADRAIARAEKIRRSFVGVPDLTDEGDLMEPNEFADADSHPDDLDRVRERIAARFGELASDLDAKGVLADVIALADAGAGRELGRPVEPAAEAA